MFSIQKKNLFLLLSALIMGSPTYAQEYHSTYVVTFLVQNTFTPYKQPVNPYSQKEIEEASRKTHAISTNFVLGVLNFDKLKPMPDSEYNQDWRCFYAEDIDFISDLNQVSIEPSIDGKTGKILFVRILPNDSCSTINMVDLKTRASKVLISNQYINDMPSWSRDEGKVFYSSKRNGRWNIYVTDTLSSYEKCLTDHLTGYGNCDYSDPSSAINNNNIVFVANSSIKANRKPMSRILSLNLTTGSIRSWAKNLGAKYCNPVFINDSTIIVTLIKQTNDKALYELQYISKNSKKEYFKTTIPMCYGNFYGASYSPSTNELLFNDIATPLIKDEVTNSHVMLYSFKTKKTIGFELLQNRVICNDTTRTFVLAPDLHGFCRRLVSSP